MSVIRPLAKNQVFNSRVAVITLLPTPALLLFLYIAVLCGHLEESSAILAILTPDHWRPGIRPMRWRRTGP
jgi:hypothetical protein